MNHKGTVTLETERLILRRFSIDDAEAMFRNCYSDPDVPKFMTWKPYDSIDAAKKYVMSQVDGYESISNYHWVIVIKELDEPIGSIGVTRYNNETRCVEIGYSIGSKWWNQGYTSEALKRLIAFFFEEVDANRIQAQHDTRNPNSGKVMVKAGMKFEGILRQSEHNNQGICDSAHYAILADDYIGCKKSVERLANITADNYTELNSKVIDRWTDQGWEWGKPVAHEVYEAALRGEWSVLLTPTRPVPHEWLGELKGKALLGLACGGGQQMPIFAALGAECTVLDYSDAMLENDRLVAKREGYAIHIVKADMTKRLPFEDSSFDIIFHPVSNCYIEDVYHVWNECYRILKPGGVLLAGLDNGFNFLFETYDRPLTIQNTYPYNPLKDSEQLAKLFADDDAIQFSHSIEEQIGGQIKAGFMLADIFEDNDAGADPGDYPGYWATRAIKPEVM